MGPTNKKNNMPPYNNNKKFKFNSPDGYFSCSWDPKSTESNKQEYEVIYKDAASITKLIDKFGKIH